MTSSQDLQARLRLVEAPRQFVPPAPSRRSFWRTVLRAIPIFIALVSTALLVYVVFGGGLPQIAQLVHRGEPQSAQPLQQQTAQAQQPQQQVPVQSPSEPGAQAQPATQQSWPPVAIGPRLAMPSDDILLMLIRSSLIALNHGNATGNYTVLRDLGAPGFQAQNSAERLRETFINFRKRALDISPILLFQPLLFRKPELNSQGMLRVMGFFPTEPERVNFELMFQPVHGRWRLFGISVDTAPYRAPQAATGKEPPPTASKNTAPTSSRGQGAPTTPPVPARAKTPPPSPLSQTKQKTDPERLAPKTDVDVKGRVEASPTAPVPEPTKPAPQARDPFNPYSQ